MLPFALDPGLLVGSTDDEILRSYVDLVRGWRGRAARSGMRLRQTDLAVLVAILGTDRAEIERRLVAATACSSRASRRGRRLLLAALVLGLASRGAQAVSSATAAQPDRRDPDAVVVGDPIAFMAPIVDQEVAVAGGPIAPSAPSLDPDDAEADPPPVTTVASLPAGAEAVLTVATLGIDLPIILGGQAVIDQGVVAHYTAPGWEPPVAPGAAGTYWLAAHHASHGQPFLALPDVAIGAEVRVRTSSHTFVYTVTSTEVTGLQPGDEAVYGSDPMASVILLQTCIDATRRLLVHGTLTATL